MSLDTLAASNQERGGAVKGVALGLVTQNQDPDGLGRVKLRFPWHSDQAETDWVRIAVPMAGMERGRFCLPEVGDEVLVAFERGDMTAPYVIGALWNGQDKPPASNDDGKNNLRVFKTRKGHTLSFDDDDAKGKIDLALADGKHKLTIDDDGIKLEDGNGNSFVIESQAGNVTIEAKTKLTLKGQMVAIEAGGTMSIKSSGTMTLQGSLININ